jgi:DNA-binding HxlR family transcriptional regulator
VAALLDRVADKWSALVILVLLDGPQRFTQLAAGSAGLRPRF